jgi:hypothetical protein
VPAEAIYVLALAWLPVLVTAEIALPRLRFDPRRWATVFPLCMYAAAGFAVARLRAGVDVAGRRRVAVGGGRERARAAFGHRPPRRPRSGRCWPRLESGVPRAYRAD